MANIRYGVFPDGQKWKLCRQDQQLGKYDSQELAIEAGRMAARAEPKGVNVQFDVLDYFGELRQADVKSPTGRPDGRGGSLRN